MARVVQRRSNPPYLAIVFVFLTFICAALAGLFYTQWSDAKQRVQDLQADVRSFVGDVPSSEVTARIGAARQPTGQPVSLQYQTEQARLLAVTAGEKGVAGETVQNLAEAAIRDGEEFLKTFRWQKGLIELAKDLKNQLDEAQAARAQAVAQAGNLNQQLAQAQQAQAENATKLQQQVDALGQQLEAKQRGLAELDALYKADVATQKNDYSSRIQEREDKITQLTKDMQEQSKQVAALQGRIAELMDVLKTTRPDPSRPTLYRADGRIFRTRQDGGVVYIDIGRRDRVPVGIPFEVYDAHTGITEDGKGKATIVVTNVMDTTAEARIQRAERGNPILEGDIINNIAFDRSRVYMFVVEGDFDLDGDGKVDPGSNQRIRDMVSQYGGQLADRVTARTDFVVVGEEPVPVVQPAHDDDTASAPAAPVSTVPDERAQRYQQAQKVAIELQIPVLNANRFMAYIGFDASLFAQAQ